MFAALVFASALPGVMLLSARRAPQLQLALGDGAVTLSNGYTLATIDLTCPQLSELKADSTGAGAFGAAPNLATGGGIRLELQPFDHAGCTAQMLRGGDGVGAELGDSAMPVFACPYAQLPARSSGREGCRPAPIVPRVLHTVMHH